MSVAVLLQAGLREALPLEMKPLWPVRKQGRKKNRRTREKQSQRGGERERERKKEKKTCRCFKVRVLHIPPNPPLGACPGGLLWGGDAQGALTLTGRAAASAATAAVMDGLQHRPADHTHTHTRTHAHPAGVGLCVLMKGLSGRKRASERASKRADTAPTAGDNGGSGSCCGGG